MWSYNVARSLARRADFAVTPGKVPQNNENMIAAAEAYLRRGDPASRGIIKVHMKLHLQGHIKVIYNTREIRDRIYSFCRFMNRPLDEHNALDLIKDDFDVQRHYEQWPSSSILRIPYEAIERDSADLIRRIAGFMGLEAFDASEIQAISDELGKNLVKKKIAELDRRAFRPDGSIGAKPVATVIDDSGSVRAFDEDTGFQTGHISDYRSGDWQHLWSEEQKKLVDEAIRIATESLAH